ncbi:MAG: sulfatase [Christensenellales bacterium]|jgi:arylsulfatase A-like enzyme
MKKPNVIFIMTDDQGYGDLSCMGAKDFVTPNIDALAQNGARFTSMYANSPVCSPSRAALLTGRYPGNAGVRAILAGHRRASGLTPDIPTIATALKHAGYTTALSGKWHLGLTPESRPNANGFDQFSGFLAGCIDYYSHIFYWGIADGRTDPTHDLWENENEVYANGDYMTERITRKAVTFIREQRDQPFFLYVAYNAPHYPMHAPETYMRRFSHLPWDRRVMAAMISAVDDGVGDIRDELARQGQLENTIIYYQSDNGPSRETRNWLDGTEDPYYGGTSGIFTGHKYSLFEGGIRVPGIFSWPARVPAGQVIDAPCASMDLFPTVLEAVGVPHQKELDGVSLLPHLINGTPLPVRDLYWEMDGQTAMRRGDMKLVLNGQLVELQQPRAEVFLSNLAADPGERQNLANEMPELAEEMRDAALTWRTALEKNWDERFKQNDALT